MGMIFQGTEMAYTFLLYNSIHNHIIMHLEMPYMFDANNVVLSYTGLELRV